jgi:hypothetical protein
MMKLVTLAASAAAIVIAVPTAALADTNQTITSTSSGSATIGGVTFGVSNAPSESSGGGSNAVTATRPDTLAGAGDTGSLELHGDRTRFVIGSLYGTNGPTGSNGFALSSLSSFTFDWNVDTVGQIQPHGSPAARVIVADNNGARTELIWEQVYNGGKAGTEITQDQWINAGANSVWYANVRGPGGAQLSTFKANSQADTTGFTTEGGSGAGVVYNASGSQINQTLSAWTQYFSADARVIGLSFGVGSTVGSNFTGFVDNAAITTTAGVDRLNFDVAAVPEPATWAMMLVGFGMVGASARYRRRSTKASIA